MSGTKSNDSRMSHRVLGVAGHIDHGKSALVKTLTGTDTDRLPEEKKRGITIENGFARWQISEEQEVSIIDMPGHEKFVRHMVAGASGIDAVLMVVAADDGVMPQTKEHLAVCEMMGVKRGIIVISKCDLVDDDMAELAALDAQEAAAGTFLEDAPIVTVSAHKRIGIELLQKSVLEMLAAMPSEGVIPSVYFPIDRVFSKAGFGTVVTGTLSAGQINEGDELEVVPGIRGEPFLAKVRGVQVHSKSAEQAQSGQRAALNLKAEQNLSRGQALVRKGRVAVSDNLLVHITLLEDAFKIEERDEVTLHLGSSETIALASVIGASELLPGQSGLLRLASQEPIAAFADQRLVLRKPGAHGQATLGGGRVIDPSPRVSKGAYVRWESIKEKLLSDDLGERAAALVSDARESGVRQDELLQRLPMSVSSVDEVFDDDTRKKHNIKGSDVFVDVRFIDAAAELIEKACAAFHKAHPLLFALAEKELETQLPEISRGVAQVAIESLIEKGALVRVTGGVKQAGHDPQQGESGAQLVAVESVYQRAGVQPLSDDKAREASKLGIKEFKDAARALTSGGRLVRSGDLYFHAEPLGALREKVRAHFSSSETLSTSEFKELAGGVSRKFAIPLLEWLDKDGTTRRKGDARVQGRKV